MRLRRLPLALALSLSFSFLCLLSEAGAWGRLYTLTGEIPVRVKPSDSAAQAKILKAGRKVRVDVRDDTWAVVYEPQEQERSEARALGYARLSELRRNGIVEVTRKKDGATSIEVRRPDEGDVGKSEAKKPEEKKIDAKKQEPQKAEAPKPDAKKADVPKTEARPTPFGEIRVADRDLMVRASRDKDSAFRRLLKPGQKVRVDFHEDGWYAVFDPAEHTRDLSRSWGYSRDKFLRTEAEYAAKPQEHEPEHAAEAAKADDSTTPTVAYVVVERREEKAKGGKAKVGRDATLRVRLDLGQPPTQDMLRKIVREIWKAERRKDEDLRLEVLLRGMDAHGLAYAVARFHEDGRLREFWWREVVLDKPAK
jgi:hypothetical protein